MKQTNIYEIHRKALKSGRAVYSIQQLANLVQKTKKVAAVYASRLIKKNLAKKLLRGKISFSEDDHINATQLIEPAYISLFSALNFHNITEQVPANVECVTTKNSIRYGRLGITYHKIPTTLFYGYEKYRKGDSYIFVADAEKALVDAVYLNTISRVTCKAIAEKLNKEKLARYIKQFSGIGRKKLEAYFL